MQHIARAKAFYQQGCAFLRCAERCMGEENEDGSIQIIGGKYNILFAPTMVNSAFSCEMFLKAILIAHEIDYMERLHYGERHELKPLFDLLPKQEYKEWLQIGTEEKFEADLTKHSSDFKNWRYYMEKPKNGSMSPIFTFILMNNLKTLAASVAEAAEKGVL